MVGSFIDARDAESTMRHIGTSRPGGTSPASLTARKLLEEDRNSQHKLSSVPHVCSASFNKE